jgi:hypothetical protein
MPISEFIVKLLAKLGGQSDAGESVEPTAKEAVQL